MKKIINFSFLLAVILISFSCKKDDPKPTPQQLILGKWKITASSTTFGSITTQADACEKDDIADFKADNTLIIDEGPTKCLPTDPQQVTNNWTMNAEGNKLTIVGSQTGGIAVVFTIVSISSTQVVLKATNVLGLGVDADITYAKI